MKISIFLYLSCTLLGAIVVARNCSGSKCMQTIKPYCEMMQALSIDAEYDEKNHRCIYKTLSQFVIGHTVEHLRQFRGCDEKPSIYYSAGIDDGTSDKHIYDKLTLKKTARISALKVDMSKLANGAGRGWEGESRRYCDPRGNLTIGQLSRSRAKFQVFNHQFKAMSSQKLTTDWKDQYPLNECTDFSRDAEWALEQESNGLAIKRGELIDIPTLVPTSVMCSIDGRAECHTRRPCKEGQKCVTSEEWNKDTQGFTKCECIAYHVKDAGTQTCRWQDDRTDKGKVCAMIGIKDGQMEKLTVGDHYYLSHVGNLDDKVNYLVVRDKCTVSLYSHPGYDSVSNNYALIRDAKAGEYDVPNTPEDMFGFEWGFAASSAKCSCQ